MKKYTPAGLTSSIRIAASTVKDYLVAYIVHRQVNGYYKKTQDKCEYRGWPSRRMTREDPRWSIVLVISGLVCENYFTSGVP